MLRRTIQSNKDNYDLPVGISRTWRQRPGKSPYLELMVNYRKADGQSHGTKHFYVGVKPCSMDVKRALKKAVAFRKSIENEELALPA